MCIKLSLLSLGGARRFDPLPLNTPLTSTEADKLTSVAMLRTRWIGEMTAVSNRACWH